MASVPALLAFRDRKPRTGVDAYPYTEISMIDANQQVRTSRNINSAFKQSGFTIVATGRCGSLPLQDHFRNLNRLRTIADSSCRHHQPNKPFVGAGLCACPFSVSSSEYAGRPLCLPLHGTGVFLELLDFSTQHASHPF